MSRAICIHPADNVATALENSPPGQVAILGETSTSLVMSLESITRGHKVALRVIAAGEPVIKFGVTIGRATSEIAVGAWVHTHNCASLVDTRSSTLDCHTGAPTDTKYE